MRFAAVAACFALVTSGALACSNSSSSNPDGPDAAQGGGDADSGLVSCDDPNEQTYAPNMQQAGASGVFTFVLVSSLPAPPADQSNVFVVQLLDAGGQPVVGATLTAVATMPTMTHGTTPVQITDNGDGTYTLSPLYFFMGGVWQTAIHVTSGSQQDTTSFYFCVAG